MSYKISSLPEGNKWFNIVQSHLDAERNLIEGCNHFPVILNNKPFIHHIGDTSGDSLHTLFTTTLDFSNKYLLSLEYKTLFDSVEQFIDYLYQNICLNSSYKGSRVITLTDHYSFPEFHQHRALVSEGLPLGDSIDKSKRTTLTDEQLTKVWEKMLVFKNDFVQTSQGQQLMNQIIDQSNHLGNHR